MEITLVGRVARISSRKSKKPGEKPILTAKILTEGQTYYSGVDGKCGLPVGVDFNGEASGVIRLEIHSATDIPRTYKDKYGSQKVWIDKMLDFSRMRLVEVRPGKDAK